MYPPRKLDSHIEKHFLELAKKHKDALIASLSEPQPALAINVTPVLDYYTPAEVSWMQLGREVLSACFARRGADDVQGLIKQCCDERGRFSIVPSRGIPTYLKDIMKSVLERYNKNGDILIRPNTPEPPTPDPEPGRRFHKLRSYVEMELRGFKRCPPHRNTISHIDTKYKRHDEPRYMPGDKAMRDSQMRDPDHLYVRDALEAAALYVLAFLHERESPSPTERFSNSPASPIR